ncbi:hypothetical protein EDD11_009746 [Mortierella claussenii]|nr:hypothetical protein EDD11_009746 [Mortierella claussenii]
MDSPYDEWSKNVHAVITFLKPFFDDWRSYASLASALMGIGVLIMENQVLLRMRMGRWEILGYVLWCININCSVNLEAPMDMEISLKDMQIIDRSAPLDAADSDTSAS